MFASQSLENAHGPETEFLVQRHGWAIGGFAYDGNHLAEAAGFTLLDQMRQQGASDAVSV